MHSRLTVIDVAASKATQPLCDAVYSGLSATPKTLPCRFFYDESGSEIFEEITDLPEYYLTRCETQLLERYADEIVSATGAEPLIVEFGSGSSVKTRLLIEAALKRHPNLSYTPIDISREFLVKSSHALLECYPELAIQAVAAEYLDAIDHVPNHDGPRLFLFLGSNIGNFITEEAIGFLMAVQAIMQPHDRLLIGADLVKDSQVLHNAYNDSKGVTAEFNFNLLRRINKELGANFDLDAFEHIAPFDHEKARIEMTLRCTRPHRVTIEDLDSSFDFEEGEIVTTEYSHKYTPDSIKEMAAVSGLLVERHWSDDLGYFAQFLFRKNCDD